VVVGQERFAYMEPRKMFLFENQNAFAGAGEEGCGGAPAWSSSNDDRVVSRGHMCG